MGVLIFHLPCSSNMGDAQVTSAEMDGCAPNGWCTYHFLSGEQRYEGHGNHLNVASGASLEVCYDRLDPRHSTAMPPKWVYFVLWLVIAALPVFFLFR